jgi:TusA-related sulfurtransferase
LDPFQTVIRSTTELKPGQHLQLLLDDPPGTFICALDRLGYECFAEIKNGTWNAYFRKGKGFDPGSVVFELDVRRLEPPLPLLKVLESLPSISEGGVLKVLYPNRPDSLVDKLRTHGFEVARDETEGSHFVLQIWKKKN